MLVLGIDPGKSGAAVLVDEQLRIVEARRDFKSLSELVLGCGILAGAADFCVIELVNAMPGQGVVSMFHFGEAYGAAKGALYCTGAGVGIKPLEIVAPVKWQNWVRARYGEPKPAEFDARDIAAQLMGVAQAAQYLSRVKDHNTADAYLMAVYGHAIAPNWAPPAPVAKRRKPRKRKL